MHAVNVKGIDFASAVRANILAGGDNCSRAVLALSLSRFEPGAEAS